MTTPLIAHVIYRLGVGGLENGLVNLINRIPETRYRHAVICLKEATDFRLRLPPGVAVFALQRREGQDFGLFRRLHRLLRQLRPALVHTRNLATLECQLPAWLAGVRARVHGEHGWDVFDPDGERVKYRLLRRTFRPLIHRYIPLSRQLETYLRESVGVPSERITRICNGVDRDRFQPPRGGREPLPGEPFGKAGDLFLIGTIGRMHGVKDQLNLVRAFLRVRERRPELAAKARLVLVGDGPLRMEANALLGTAGAASLAWLPGEREDIPALLRGLDLFVLPSRAEGISNTILEAMASGLPVVATEVGGNPELVTDGITGRLVPPRAPEALAEALLEYLAEPERARRHGAAGLARVEAEFGLDRMVERYLAVYDGVLAATRTAG